MGFQHLTETRQAAPFPLGWHLRPKLPGSAVPLKSPERPTARGYLPGLAVLTLFGLKCVSPNSALKS